MSKFLGIGPGGANSSGGFFEDNCMEHFKALYNGEQYLDELYTYGMAKTSTTLGSVKDLFIKSPIEMKKLSMEHS